MVILETKALKKIYGEGETAVHALNDVNLKIKKGETVALIGVNGSGKFDNGQLVWEYAGEGINPNDLAKQYNINLPK